MARRATPEELDNLRKQRRVQAAINVGRDMAQQRARAKTPQELERLRASEIQRKVQILKGNPVERYRRQRDLARSEAPKPEKTSLYTKAGPGGLSLGDCPYSHSVQMALRLKGVDYDVLHCGADTKPKWLVDEVDGKLPCVFHEGVLHVESSEILAWVDAEFEGQSLSVPAELVESLRGCFGFFPALTAFTKNTDDALDDELRAVLRSSLGRLRDHLAARKFGFLCGEKPTLADCDLLPKLYVLEHATPHFKAGSRLGDLTEGEEVRDYYARGAVLAAFSEAAYSADTCIWGWGEARKAA